MIHEYEQQHGLDHNPNLPKVYLSLRRCGDLVRMMGLCSLHDGSCGDLIRPSLRLHSGRYLCLDSIERVDVEVFMSPGFNGQSSHYMTSNSAVIIFTSTGNPKPFLRLLFRSSALWELWGQRLWSIAHDSNETQVTGGSEVMGQSCSTKCIFGYWVRPYFTQCEYIFLDVLIFHVKYMIHIEYFSGCVRFMSVLNTVHLKELRSK